MHLLVIALLAMRPTMGPNPVEQIPPRVRGFLQYLTSVAPGPDERGKQYRLKKPIQAAILSDYVSTSGVAFSDVAGGTPKQVGLDQLQKELKSERGLIYRYIVGLAVDAASYQDYSKISVVRKGGLVSVTLSSYNLRFVVEGGLLKLAGIEYTDPGGD